VPDQVAGKLVEISGRLDDAARKLQADELDSEEATRLAGECAELAAQAAAELERAAKAAPHESVPGQEELL
jgi:hypothetical protein